MSPGAYSAARPSEDVSRAQALKAAGAADNSHGAYRSLGSSPVYSIAYPLLVTPSCPPTAYERAWVLLIVLGPSSRKKPGLVWNPRG